MVLRAINLEIVKIAQTYYFLAVKTCYCMQHLCRFADYWQQLIRFNDKNSTMEQTN